MNRVVELAESLEKRLKGSRGRDHDASRLGVIDALAVCAAELVVPSPRRRASDRRFQRSRPPTVSVPAGVTSIHVVVVGGSAEPVLSGVGGPGGSAGDFTAWSAAPLSAPALEEVDLGRPGSSPAAGRSVGAKR